jgi:muramoyltetrapeptide carboxypeptidase
VAAALAGAATVAWGGARRREAASLSPLVRPPRVRRGDLVGLIAPGGAIEDDQIERAVRNIESLGLAVKTGANIRLRRGNYAGTAYQQVQDFHAMVRDRDVKAIWSARGGSGCSLMLPLLDYGLIRAHAKVFVGLSDATALHLAIHRHARIVTFHGPAGISTFSDYSVAYLRAAFMDPRPSYTIVSAPENIRRGGTQPEFAERTITAGVATGALMGGNLSVLSALVGTPYAARMAGTIAFLEDIDEAPYRINRMLTQLVQSGELTRAAGVMFGGCVRCVVPPGDATLSLEETLHDRLEPLHVPAAMGMSFGHLAHHFTMPIGIRARFDASERTLTILEPAVV